jgi:predicted outer membrane repeat protein
MRSFLRRFPALRGLQLIALLCAALATVATATVKGAPPPTLGNYPHPIISLSANTIVVPDAAPTNTAAIIVTTSTNRSSLPTPIPTPTPTPPSLIVTNLNDNGPGSLRQLLADAHDGDRIQFDPALNGQAITLTSGQLVVNKNIAISGPGASLLTIRRDPQSPTFRIFFVGPGATVIEGVTITGGYEIMGGGIWNFGTLTMTDSIVTGNTVGNAIPFPSATPTPPGFGAGILNYGLLTIHRSTISNNTATGFVGEGGGIDGGSMVITESTISHNHADNDGGGIYGSVFGSTIAIIDSTVDDNTAGGDGGGIYCGSFSLQNSTVSNNQSAGGAGIFTGHYFSGDPYPVTITNSTFSGNSSNGAGSSIINNNALQIGNTIIKRGGTSVTIRNDSGTITSLGYNLSNDIGPAIKSTPIPCLVLFRTTAGRLSPMNY